MATIVFIDGGNNCDHNWNGDSVYRTSRGKTIFWHTFRKWARFTTMFRRELIMDHQNEIDDPVVEETGTCTKCKAIFSPHWHIG